MITVILTQPHTHAGRTHQAGERLDVDGSTADWLIANGVARRAPDAPDEPIRPTTTQRKESKP